MSGSQSLDGFELIVHIGMGKTGSSSIQKTLATNEESILGQGIGYLGTMCESAPEKLFSWQKPGGWPDLIAEGPAAAQAQLEAALTDTLKHFLGLGARRAIWSNESIWGNHKLAIPVLKQLESFGVRNHIVVYVRRHDEWARSAYLQWGIKHKTYSGPVRSFRDWYQSQTVNFAAGLKPWIENTWADITVRNFDACGDVVVDFLGYCGLQSQKIAPRRDNETPNPVALALWAIYNSQISRPVLPVELQRLLAQSGILQNAPVACELASLLPSQGDIESVRADLEKDRDKINEIFRRFGQPEMDTAPLRAKEMTVSQGKINAAFLLMIKHQSDQIAALRRKVQKLSGDAKGDGA